MRRLTRKVKRMSNSDLREALWDIRKKTGDIASFSGDEKNNLLKIEGIYAEELKRRELLEWALRTGKDDPSE
ncbi:MAG: hypothetical protein KGD59_00405 [Candidatus Heimdallarchaeota archaeon]|nr:hypothetical protein [Candidatus Heimdallarchaeota archaeon]MBY8992978.1 hypothetical protein [Candidatus Heimdallarchaeota archaeon]